MQHKERQMRRSTQRISPFIGNSGEGGSHLDEESRRGGCLRAGRQRTAGKECQGILWDAAHVLQVDRGVDHTAVYTCTHSLSCTLKVCEFHWIEIRNDSSFSSH